MALLLKCGAVFLHIPKTGGSWVTKVLDDQGLIERKICHIHADWFQALRYINIGTTVKQELSAHVKSHLSENFKRGLRQAVNNRKTNSEIDQSPYIFCFVRHPLKWYESFWRYMCAQNWPRLGNQYDVNDWHPNAILNGLGDPEFNQFVRNIIAKRPGFVTEMYGWYTWSGVNFVGKQERLVEDLLTVLRQLNVTFDEDRIRNYRPVNVSSQKNSNKIVWDESLHNEILRLESAAIRRYCY
ncbi:MAG TPA: sulfotransferase family 2 domain-containing protein [Anaerolineae bacterium]|nr:sulfotransferase family 2 domain-containing protein [Anaerolineae bacterium]